MALSPDHDDLNAIAPPWPYNPSAWHQRLPICLLAMVGFVISAYLALYERLLIGSVRDPVFGEGTRRVLDSDVAHRLHCWFGIPDAALGAVAYLGDAVLVLLQATLVGRWCFLCLVSAAIAMVLIYFAYDEVWSSLLYLKRVWRRTGRVRTVWHVLWGGDSSEASAVALEH